MFKNFITSIDYPALIAMQSKANVVVMKRESIKGLKASEKAMLNNVEAKVKAKNFSKRYK